jgi:zinc protease
MINSWLAHDVPGWELALIRTFIAPEHVTATATLVDTEVRRAREYGFSALEVDAAVRDTAVAVAQREANAANLSSAVLAQALAFSIARNVVFVSPADERAFHERVLQEFDADECLEALRSLWPLAGTHVLLSGPLPKNRIENGVLRTEINLARAVPVSRPKPQPAPRPFPHTDYGPAGEVVEQRHDAATDCWLVTFANGVRLNFKRTAHEREWVRLQVRFGHGHLGAPSDRPLLPWGIFALTHTGMKGVANEELSSPLLGLSFDKHNSLNLDSFGWSAELPSRDFTRGMHYAAAVLRHTDWANAPEAIVRSTLSSIFAPGEHTARGVAETQFRHAQVNVPGVLLGNTKEAAKFPLHSATDWIQAQLSDCPIEITVVGDVERDAVVAAVAHTLGAFSKRQPLMSRDDPRRVAAWPTPGVREVRFEGNKGLGVVIMGWTAPDAAGRADDATLSLLAEIIRDRLSAHVREKLGLTYSPSAFLVSHHEVRPRRVVLQCYLEAAPRQLARVTDAARNIIAAIARDGVTADEMERARRPLLRQASSNQRSNSWWLHQLSRAQSDPESTEGLTDFQAALKACTLEEINALARTLLDLNKAHQISALPK